MNRPYHIAITEAKIADLEEILALLSQLSPPMPDEKLENEQGMAVLESIISNPDYCLCVAGINGKLIGTALLLLQRNLSHGGRPYAHLENVVTDINYRGKGVGMEMVNFLISKAREQDCYKIILNCELKNIPFYKNCGFNVTGEVEMRISNGRKGE